MSVHITVINIISYLLKTTTRLKIQYFLICTQAGY